MDRNRIRENAIGLTQRLDHMVPDPDISGSENQKAAADLAALSAKLFWHVPDQSLSPFERIERLGRAAEKARPDMSQLQPASKKVAALRRRIDQLVPGDMTHERKIELLIQKLDQKVGSSQAVLPTTDKLELLGDPRSRIAPELKKTLRKRTKR